jgi:hypothetical protein
MSDDPKVKALELAIHGGGDHAQVVARAAAYHSYLTGGKLAPVATTAGKSGTAPAATGKPAPAATTGKPAQQTAKPGAATGKPAQAAKPAAKPAAAAAQAGKYSIDQVREIIKKVVATDGLGKEMAVELLDTEGGVKKISDLKPADYDKVYEACDGALHGGEAGATGDAGAVEFDEDDPTA